MLGIRWGQGGDGRAWQSSQKEFYKVSAFLPKRLGGLSTFRHGFFDNSNEKPKGYFFLESRDNATELMQ